MSFWSMVSLAWGIAATGVLLFIRGAFERNTNRSNSGGEIQA